MIHMQETKVNIQGQGAKDYSFLFLLLYIYGYREYRGIPTDKEMNMFPFFYYFHVYDLYTREFPGQGAKEFFF